MVKKNYDKGTQICDEVDYFINYYQELKPKAFLSYEREAYYSKELADFRVSFDVTILSRLDDLSLCSDVYGNSLLPEGKILMEIKCLGGIPMWLVDVLSKEHIYKTSFSKYGTAYQTMIFPNIKGVNLNA